MSFSVLVLDDEPWQLTWIDDLTVALGGSCIFAQTYDEAKAAFDAHAPAIAVVDIRIGDVDEPLKGATLEHADPSWVGLRFLRFVRVERTSSATRLMVYTGLDRENLQKIVQDAYKAAFFTKFEGPMFQQALRNEMEKLQKAK